MKHLGDITKIHGNAVEIVDVVTGGSPCQDLSVAGKRAGLAGERSGLFMEQIRIIKEMRDECERRLYDAGADYNRTDVKPRYMVWENVAGAFSSNAGEDFRAVLEETAKVADKDAYVPGLEGGKWSPCGCILGNGWSIAWRLHDSQWWGVPQRRKRICLLADFNGDTAGKVLFELQRETTNRDTEQAIVDIGAESRSEVQSVSEGVSGDIAQSGKEGERVAENTERCTNPASYTLKVRGGAEFDRYGKRAGKGALVQTELSGTLGVSQDQTLIQCMNPWDVQSKHIQPENGVADPLYAGECRGGGGESYVMQATAFEPGAMSRVGGHTYEDVAGTVRANAGDNQQAVVYGIGSYDSNAMKSDNPHSGIYKADTSRTLDLNGGNPGCNQGGMAVVCLEGNGQRDSHKGDGYKESETMYTLNTVEQHAICTGFDSYNLSETGDVGRCLTTAGGGLNEHTPIILENHPADSRVKISEDGVCQTLSGRMGTGGGNVPMVMEQSNWDGSQVSPTLTANNANGSQRMPDKDNFNAVISAEVYHCTSENDKVQTLKARDYKDPQVVAYGLDRAAYNQGQNAQYNFSVDEEKVGTCVAKGPNAVCKNGGIYAGTQNKVLCLLSETYGEETVEKWGIAILAALQSSEILQSRVHESSISSETENRHKLDGSSLPCPSVVAGWLLRDMRKQQECGCSPHRRQSTEQQPEKSEKGMPELSQQNPQTCKEMFDMWEKGEGLGLLRQTLSEIQEVWQSFNGKGQSVHRCSIVRRLTPLEAERLQGFPDNWTNIGDWVDSKGKTHKGESDSPRYKALGNSIALPFWAWMAERMMPYLPENPTMASLFDGIGGFPIVFSRCGCKPVWASEIEEFPIAVTKIRFPEN